MRGRTLENSFVILDEAQNATISQLKMFLTRMGVSSKFILTGDTTQIDLPRRSESGLLQAMHLLEGIEGISIIRFDERDIVRHRLVKNIVRAYDSRGEEQKGRIKAIIRRSMAKAITGTDFNFPRQKGVYRGKVRDVYNIDDKYLLMVVTDRISAFDVVLPEGIPYKGQVLNQIATMFLEMVSDIVPVWNIASPDPNVTVGVRCQTYPLR
jgi:hypothetical protein